jgi:hypothetical protein
MLNLDGAYLAWLARGPLGLGLCVLGILGSVLSVVVWAGLRRMQGASIIVYFIMTSVVNCLLLGSVLLCESLPALLPSVRCTFWYTLLYSYAFYPAFFLCLVTSILLTVAMTLDRS